MVNFIRNWEEEIGLASLTLDLGKREGGVIRNF